MALSSCRAQPPETLRCTSSLFPLESTENHQPLGITMYHPVTFNLVIHLKYLKYLMYYVGCIYL